jgi:predicted PurR-regulated permease PerM
MLLWFLLCCVTTLAVIALVVVFCQWLFSLVAILGIVLVLSYLLLSLVNGTEAAIVWVSDRVNQAPGLKHILGWSPRANPRLLAVLMVFLMVWLGLGYGIVTLTPVLMAQFQSFISSLPHHLHQLWQSLQKTSVLAPTLVPTGAHEPAGATLMGTTWPLVQISSLAKSALAWVHQTTAGLWDGAWDGALGVAEGVGYGFLNILCAGLLVFYALLDGPKLVNALVKTSPQVFQSSLAFIVQQTHRIMMAFIKGQVLLGALTGTYMFVVYTIFGVPYALFLAVVFFLAELLPVVGTWIGITTGLITIFLFGDPWTALPVWLCSYGYQTIKDNFLAPKIVGNVMGLHPVLVLLAILMGAQAGGLIGIILALPMASLLMATVRYWLKGAHHHLSTASVEVAG